MTSNNTSNSHPYPSPSPQTQDPPTMPPSPAPQPPGRTYKQALQILNSRRRLGRPVSNSNSSSDLAAGLKRVPVRSSGGGDGGDGGDGGVDGGASGEAPDLKGTPSIVGMGGWLRRVGHEVSAISRLNVIHVAGTKGKGSTCAFIESFLRAHGRRRGWPSKTGLYTSPHLIYPEERIRLNFAPLSREVFARYFFEVWDALTLAPREEAEQQQPRYLQLLALLSFHAFIREGVDVAVIETHNGGEFDATNVIEHPVVTAVTSLGMDHVRQLGPSIENIAWHKAGIFKAGAEAFSAPQESEAAEALRARAVEKGVDLRFVERDDPALPAQALQLTPQVQRMNCSLALAVVRAFLMKMAAAATTTTTLNAEDVEEGLSQFSWPGRFQIVAEEEGKEGMQWFLDGAHNEMSIAIAAEWFVQASSIQEGALRAPARKVLIFSQISHQRDSVTVFERLAKSLSSVALRRAVLTTYDLKHDFSSVPDAQPKILEPRFQDACTKIWNTTHPGSEVVFEPSIQQAIAAARQVRDGSGPTQTFITGSQHLVGSALYTLESEKSNQRDAA